VSSVKWSPVLPTIFVDCPHSQHRDED